LAQAVPSLKTDEGTKSMKWMLMEREPDMLPRAYSLGWHSQPVCRQSMQKVRDIVLLNKH